MTPSTLHTTGSTGVAKEVEDELNVPDPSDGQAKAAIAANVSQGYLFGQKVTVVTNAATGVVQFFDDQGNEVRIHAEPGVAILDNRRVLMADFQ